ncbi:MAG: protein translocase subunit SecF [Actinomycetota bacterium]|nr:protein translocase subunit SecF [Actinomycetota bacterium]
MLSAELGNKLYTGEKSYDFIGRRRRWYAFSALLIVISIGSLAFRGMQLSIDFSGGGLFSLPTAGHSVEDARRVVEEAAGVESIPQELNNGDRMRIRTEAVNEQQADKIRNALSEEFDVPREQIAVTTVGASWGQDISRKALQGLVVFLILVVVYLSLRYEWKMALGAVVAVVHDVLITAGLYSLVGFEVSPSTVIALLTILGFSLYDTVVVFDKVRENTKGITGGSRMTFSEATNLAVNQTLARSINTSIIALLPVAALLFIGAGLLGAGTLKDLALALLIGLAAGAYSSIFLACPLLCDLKEREPQMQALARRVEARRSGGGRRAESSTPTRTEARAVGAASAARPAAGTIVLNRPGTAAPSSDDEPELPDEPVVHAGPDGAADSPGAVGPSGSGSRSTGPAGRASTRPRPGGSRQAGSRSNKKRKR